MLVARFDDDNDFLVIVMEYFFLLSNVYLENLLLRAYFLLMNQFLKRTPSFLALFYNSDHLDGFWFLKNVYIYIYIYVCVCVCVCVLGVLCFKRENILNLFFFWLQVSSRNIQIEPLSYVTPSSKSRDGIGVIYFGQVMLAPVLMVKRNGPLTLS